MTVEQFSGAQWVRLKGPLLRLEGSICPKCRKIHFPPRPYCYSCNGKDGHRPEEDIDETVTVYQAPQTDRNHRWTVGIPLVGKQLERGRVDSWKRPVEVTGIRPRARQVSKK